MTSNYIRTLLIKHKEGTISEDEKKILDDWYENTLRIKEDFLEESVSNKYNDKGADLFSKINQAIDQEEHKINTKPLLILSWNILIMKAAAIFVLVLGIGLLIYFLPSNSKAPVLVYKELINPTGKQAFITLSDGSKIWLNADSKLVYPEYFGASQRIVSLTGEAFFEIAKNPDKPFIVNSGSLQTKVLGTSFNIKAYPETQSQEIAVITGKVAVRISGNNQHQNQVNLVPDQMVRYDQEKNNLSVTTIRNASDVHAWKSGQLNFTRIPVTEAFRMIERYYSVKIQADNQNYQKCLITARFTKAPLIEVLNTLKISLNLEYTLRGSNIYIKGGDICK